MTSEVCVAPFVRSYWVAPGQLLAGYYPGDEDPCIAREKLGRLLDVGIRCIVNLMEEDELDHEGLPFTSYEEDFRRLAAARSVEVDVLRFPIHDMKAPARVMMRAILDAIDGCIERGRPVYVHCWGGVGRTGTVVGCWLARHGIATGDEAIARIAELRQRDVVRRDRKSPETKAQRALVRSWRVGE